MAQTAADDLRIRIANICQSAGFARDEDYWRGLIELVQQEASAAAEARETALREALRITGNALAAVWTSSDERDTALADLMSPTVFGIVDNALTVFQAALATDPPEAGA